MSDEWTLLKSFNSQSEARVVESFLRAQGFETLLLDQHTFDMMPAKVAGITLRLMVRPRHLERAIETLEEAERRSHLKSVDELDPPEPPPGGTPPPLYTWWQALLALLFAAMIALWLHSL